MSRVSRQLNWIATCAVATLVSTAALCQTTAIVGAKVYTLTGDAPIENATLVMRDGKILSVGPGAAPPPGATVIHAEGQIATPGLMNAATQLGLVEVSAESDTTDQSVSSGPLGASFDVQYAENANSTLLPIVRADGLTRAVSAPALSEHAPFSGTGVVLRLVSGPDIIDRPQAAVFAAINGKLAGRSGGSRSAAWQLLRDALLEAQIAGQPGSKVSPNLFNRVELAALQPVLASRIPLAVATDRESDIRQLMRLADDFGIKVVLVGGAEAWRIAGMLAAREIPVVLNPFENAPQNFDEIGARSDNAAILNSAHVTVAFSVPGGGRLSHDAGTVLREAAGVAVANGLPWIEALRAVTVNPAKIWGIADRYGVLAQGQDADVVLWDADPFEVTSRAIRVFVRGEQVSLTTRQTLLRDRYSPLRLSTMPHSYR